MKRLLPVLFTTLLGCTSESPDYGPLPAAVRISPLVTRVSGTNFEPEDRIGLTIRLGETVYADNRELTYDGRSFSNTSLLWYNDATQPSTLIAYWPYDAAGAPARFTVPTDQSGAGFASADLLAATRHGVVPNASPVEMLFDHLLSKVRLTVENASDGAVDRIVLCGSIPTATVDLANKQVETDEEVPAVELIPHAVDDTTSEAVVIPQLAALAVQVWTDDGKIHRYELEPTPLEGGKIYTVHVTVTNIDIGCSLSGEINDWQAGGAIGERSEDPGILTYGEVSYGLTALPDGTVWMTENLRYNPGSESDLATGAGGVRYPGAALTEAEDIAAYGLLYDGDTAQGICPEGWELPTRADCEALIGYWSSLPADFLPVIPEFCLSTGQYRESGERSYLWSSTADGAGFYDALTVDRSAALPTPGLERKAASIFLPVRCMKR